MYFRTADFQSTAPVYRWLYSNGGDTSTPNIHLKGKWLREAGFETGAHLTVEISNGCIVLILDCKEVDDFKHEKEALRQQLRDIILANLNIKSAAEVALRGMRI